MPSGDSLATIVSRTTGALTRGSGLDDDRIGEVVVQAPLRRPEDEEHVDDAVNRNDVQQAIDDVAQPEDAGDAGAAPVAAYHLDAEDLLADRLAVGAHEDVRHDAPHDHA